MRPSLSIVIPAYNEQDRLPCTLERIICYLGDRGTSAEIIVVDDGSRDRTAEVASTYLAPLGEKGRLLRFAENRGKGASVRRGMLEARGHRVLFTDADLSTPIEEIEKLEHRLAAGSKVAIGSRAVDRRTVERRQPFLREMMGRLFNLVVRAVAVGGITDTQCGFKLFAREVIAPVFGRQRIEGFGFDVEIIAIARYLQYPITEVAVRWVNSQDSRVTLRGGAGAFVDAFRVRYSLMAGHYRGLPVTLVGGAPAPMAARKLSSAERVGVHQ